MTPREAAALLREHDGYLILTHTRPDGDTVGCAAALCRALRALGKRAFVLPNPELTPLFAPYLEGLTAPEGYEPETVVAVDLASRNMFPVNAKCYTDRVALTVDHHGSQEFYAAETCVDPDRAACGEIILEIVSELGPVTKEMAEALYVAVSTDCGCFAYNNTTAATHRAAAALIDCGIDLYALNKRHFRTKSWKRLRLESAIIAGMELHDEGRIALAPIPLSLMRSLEATEADAEDIAALPGVLEGVLASVTLKELPDGGTKLSVRTDPAYADACAVCAILGGGGHAAAAGASTSLPLSEAMTAVLAAIEQVRHG